MIDEREAVARSIARSHGYDPDEHVMYSGKPAWTYKIRAADAAIAAMLETRGEQLAAVAIVTELMREGRLTIVRPGERVRSDEPCIVLWHPKAVAIWERLSGVLNPDQQS